MNDSIKHIIILFIAMSQGAALISGCAGIKSADRLISGGYTYEERKEIAKTAMQKNDLKSAVETFRSLIRENPSDLETMDLLAISILKSQGIDFLTLSAQLFDRDRDKGDLEVVTAATDGSEISALYEARDLINKMDTENSGNSTWQFHAVLGFLAIAAKEFVIFWNEENSHSNGNSGIDSLVGPGKPYKNATELALAWNLKQPEVKVNLTAALSNAALIARDSNPDYEELVESIKRMNDHALLKLPQTISLDGIKQEITRWKRNREK